MVEIQVNLILITNKFIFRLDNEKFRTPEKYDAALYSENEQNFKQCFYMHAINAFKTVYGKMRVLEITDYFGSTFGNETTRDPFGKKITTYINQGKLVLPQNVAVPLLYSSSSDETANIEAVAIVLCKLTELKFFYCFFIIVLRFETFTNRNLEVGVLSKLTVSQFDSYMSSLLHVLNKFLEYHIGQLEPKQILLNRDIHASCVFQAAKNKLKKIDECCFIQTKS